MFDEKFAGVHDKTRHSKKDGSGGVCEVIGDVNVTHGNLKIRFSGENFCEE
jgi:hypothetical protein